MSLFGDKRYQYRDTYFVLFDKKNLPTVAQIESALSDLGSRYETVDKRVKNGILESMTVLAPQDFSAMDITLVEGHDVAAQVKSIQEEFRTVTLTGEDIKKLARLQNFDVRFDIFHFEEIGDSPDGEEEFLDPGGLLLVLEKLAELCDGVALDPQSQSLM
ncbi:MAG TPA: hypothetical protein PKD64_17370 [Pirellulaceae bacterium]|nr:hypothetical protein [Pirellulaceae bacterium]HMO93959.1 hypothetical protein [Pirellulaceae bacterium]HMP67965.1 hypothetical protein [Pirellulaceae bacterium]